MYNPTNMMMYRGLSYDYAPYEPYQVTPRLQEMLMLLEPDLDIFDPDNLIAAAKKHIFGHSINALSTEYRDAFVQLFMDTYLMRCIGQETWQLFLFYLRGDVRKKAPAINILFEQLDRQYYSEYEVTERELDSNGTRTHKETVNESSKDDTTRTGTESTKDDTTGSGTSNTESTGNSTNDVTQKSTLEETSKEDGTRNGTLNEKASGSGKKENTGTVTSNGTKEDATNSTTGSTNHEVTTQDTDTVTKFSDTPQNGLAGLMNDTYLTNATVQNVDGTTTVDGNTSGTNATTSNGTTEETREDKLKETTSTEDNKDTTSSETTESNGSRNSEQDMTTNGTASSTGKSDTTTSSTSSSTGSRNTSDVEGHERTAENTRDGNEVDSRADKERTVHYKIDYERLRSNPPDFLTMIANMFRDNFMLIS